MEEIKKKAFDDEFEKSEDDIEIVPEKFIPVPKKKKKKNERDKENK